MTSIAFIFLGLVAALLNTSNKRSICLLYAVGLSLELAVGDLYAGLGLLETYPYNYYLGITLIDCSILALMTYCYDKNFLLVYFLISIMVGINGILTLERVLIGSDFILEHSRSWLEAVNVAVLLILFGRSYRVQRIMDRLRTRYFQDSGKYAGHLLRLYSRVGSQEQEK